MSKAAQNTLRITIHVSGAASNVSSPALSMSPAETMNEKSDDDIESVKSGQSTAQKQILFGRAVLPHTIHQLALGLDSQSLGVAGTFFLWTGSGMLLILFQCVGLKEWSTTSETLSQTFKRTLHLTGQALAKCSCRPKR